MTNDELIEYFKKVKAHAYGYGEYSCLVANSHTRASRIGRLTRHDVYLKLLAESVGDIRGKAIGDTIFSLGHEVVAPTKSAADVIAAYRNHANKYHSRRVWDLTDDERMAAVEYSRGVVEILEVLLAAANERNLATCKSDHCAFTKKKLAKKLKQTIALRDELALTV